MPICLLLYCCLLVCFKFQIAEFGCVFLFPPRKRDHVRIVSTTATDPEDALGDLLDEAESLPLTATGVPGEKTTTLLVCSWAKIASKLAQKKLTWNPEKKR